jgi:hypothetical protein
MNHIVLKYAGLLGGYIDTRNATNSLGIKAFVN